MKTRGPSWRLSSTVHGYADNTGFRGNLPADRAHAAQDVPPCFSSATATSAYPISTLSGSTTGGASAASTAASPARWRPVLPPRSDG